MAANQRSIDDYGVQSKPIRRICIAIFIFIIICNCSVHKVNRNLAERRTTPQSPSATAPLTQGSLDHNANASPVQGEVARRAGGVVYINNNLPARLNSYYYFRVNPLISRLSMNNICPPHA